MPRLIRWLVPFDTRVKPTTHGTTIAAKLAELGIPRRAATRRQDH